MTKKEDINEKEEKDVGGRGGNNIFVKLKSYNKSNKRDGTLSTNTSVTTNYINRYTYEGKLMNFNMLQKPEKKKFSYLDFKNKA
jgi:hypothetical protein